MKYIAKIDVNEQKDNRQNKISAFAFEGKTLAVRTVVQEAVQGTSVVVQDHCGNRFLFCVSYCLLYGCKPQLPVALRKVSHNLQYNAPLNFAGFGTI